jgi:hypothetical protein
MIEGAKRIEKIRNHPLTHPTDFGWLVENKIVSG